MEKIPKRSLRWCSLAMDFREKFHRDVIIDMYCFRRRGHNEGDEPAFTQPTMYKMIRNRQTVFESYLDSLLSLKGLGRTEAKGIVERRSQVLEEELVEARRRSVSVSERQWRRHLEGIFRWPVCRSR